MKNFHKQRFPHHESNGLNTPIVTWTAVVLILLTKTQFKILFAGKNNDAVSLSVIKPLSAAKTIARLALHQCHHQPELLSDRIAVYILKIYKLVFISLAIGRNFS